MANTRGLTDKPVTPEVLEEDGKTVAAHLSEVITDPDDPRAVQVPDPDEYPEANATAKDDLSQHSEESPADALDSDETAVNEVQRIDPTGTVSGGTYDFVLLPGTDNAAAVSEVAFDATVAEVQALVDTALGDRATDGEGNRNVLVSGVGVDSGNLDFTFQNDFGAEDQPELTVDDANITGGGSLAAVTVTAGVHSDD